MKTLSEEFEGNIPEIIIEGETRYFAYICGKTLNNLYYPCCYTLIHPLEECYDCLGYNREFARFYKENSYCTNCTGKVDFGYFIFIYLLEKAGLLPKKFKILCCKCYKKREIKEKELEENGREEER